MLNLHIHYKIYVSLLRITQITPNIINIIPAIIFKLIVSLNNRIPKNNAVIGSKAPKIAVRVAPMSLIARVIVSRDVIVGNIASPNMQMKQNQLCND